MNIKHLREIKVGIVAVVCLVLLYFGFNFLKGFNIFSIVDHYQGVYTELNGLTAQAPVYIRGYKVGQVDAIRYDFSKDSSFVVSISINRDIDLPQGTTMDLVADGLLGGSAIALSLPTHAEGPMYKEGAMLPTKIVPGLIDNIQAGLLGDLDSTIVVAKTLIANVNAQLADDHLKHSLENIDKLSGDLTVTSRSLKDLMSNRVPGIVDNLDTTLANIEVISRDIREADLKATVARVDTAVDQVNVLLAEARSTDGTLGMLLNDKTLYVNINSTVQSADSLLVDLKANPRRYVHFSLFGGKDKSDKAKKKK